MLSKIKDWLDSESISFKEIHHLPTRTSQDSAKARGENLSVGGKALVLKVDDFFALFVLSAVKKIDSNAIKKHFTAKKLRFASPEELMTLTGLVPGSVPPFGQPVLSLDLFVDTSVVNNKTIAFNAGSLTDSITMSTKDYLKISAPKIFTFSQD